MSDGAIIWEPDGVILKGDVLIKCYHGSRFSPKKMFHFAFHTAFLSNSMSMFRLDELDAVAYAL